MYHRGKTERRRGMPVLTIAAIVAVKWACKLALRTALRGILLSQPEFGTKFACDWCTSVYDRPVRHPLIAQDVPNLPSVAIMRAEPVFLSEWIGEFPFRWPNQA